MKRIIALAAVAALLAACADETSTDVVVDPGTDPDTETPTEADVALSQGDLDSAVFDSSDGALTVQITLDGNDLLQDYGTGTPRGDFTTYTYQLSQTDRFFTAAAGESADGNIIAVVAADGGQFNRFFGGTTITQLNYTAPDGGITNYTGQYIGLLNVGPQANVSAVTDSVSATPFESTIIEGDVFFKADFTDGAVNGAIFNRQVEGEFLVNREIVLTVSDINADGTFAGSAERLDQVGVGTYQGAFGGAGATSVGGSVEFTSGAYLLDPLIADVENPSNLKEYGVFVLNPAP